MIENETEDLNPSDAACCYGAVDEGGNAAQGEYSDDYDSDEDYASIQRPAFLVEGEPNFESGSPEDGLEYLRRVRYINIDMFSSPIKFLLIECKCLRFSFPACQRRKWKKSQEILFFLTA